MDYAVPLRLRSVFHRSQVERELEEELRFHLEARIQHEVAAGRTPEEARYAALRAMDGMEQRKEECRDMRHMNIIDNLERDVRYAVRTLARSPGFTVAALLALALGIGANGSVQRRKQRTAPSPALCRARPPGNDLQLPPQRWHQNRPSEHGGHMSSLPGPRNPHAKSALMNLSVEEENLPAIPFLDWRARSRSFQTLAAINFNRFTLTGDGAAEQIVGMSVSAGFFETLRARPRLGRTFAADEDRPGSTLTIVLSERLWHRLYASDPGVLGKQIVLNGRPHTVVMPGDVEFGPRDVEAWPILTLNPPTRRGPFSYRGIARLKPGVSVAQAGSEMEAIAHEVERAHPQGHTGLAFPVVPMHEVTVGRIRPLLWVLSGTVLLVLLIAVSNVANLMLARASTRRRENPVEHRRRP